MRSKIEKILKEPIVYFFVLGCVVFGLHSFLNHDTQDESAASFRVQVTSADIEWLRSSWKARMLRQPTPQELQGLIDNYIRDEIISREALTLGLDEGDRVIKNRLVQKLLFVFEDLAETVEPTDDELKEYMQAHGEKYKEPATISFSQVYLHPERHADVWKEAEGLLHRLQENTLMGEEAASLGDASMLNVSYDRVSSDRVADILGKEFAEELFQQEERRWQGPIASTFGLHLVFIDKRSAEQYPEYKQIRDALKYDFMYERKRTVIDKAYEAAKSRYTILVEGLPHE